MRSGKTPRKLKKVALDIFDAKPFAVIGMTSDEIETSIKPLKLVFVRSLCAFPGR